MNLQPHSISPVTQQQTSRSDQLKPVTAKPKFIVSLSNRGNPDLGQSPTKPLPSSRCYKKACRSVLEARRVCLEYIRKHQLGGGHWCGGQVTNALGRPVAHISYNGRLWQPQSNDTFPKKPYFPLITYDRKHCRLVVCYSHIYKEITIRAKELSGEFRFMDPFDDNRGFVLVFTPATVENLITVQIYPTQYQGRQGWIATTSEPLEECLVEFQAA